MRFFNTHCKCGCGREMPGPGANGRPRSYHDECNSKAAKRCSRWRNASEHRRQEAMKAKAVKYTRACSNLAHERLEDRIPNVLCKECFGLPHRRVAPECPGCCQPPGDETARAPDYRGVSALAQGELWA